MFCPSYCVTQDLYASPFSGRMLKFTHRNSFTHLHPPSASIRNCPVKAMASVWKFSSSPASMHHSQLQQTVLTLSRQSEITDESADLSAASANGDLCWRLQLLRCFSWILCQICQDINDRSEISVSVSHQILIHKCLFISPKEFATWRNSLDLFSPSIFVFYFIFTALWFYDCSLWSVTAVENESARCLRVCC